MKEFTDLSGIQAIWTGVEYGPNQVYDLREEESVYHFHSSIPGYQMTPLVPLSHLAERLGVANILVKDESQRFGLNAFKVLGASYAIARLIATEMQRDPLDLDFALFSEPRVRDHLRGKVFATATDGNHGRGVAWTARQLGCKAIVYMPQGAATSRIEAIAHEGAEVHVTDLNYDDTVRLVRTKADVAGWQIIQDTAWPGYEDIPRWIALGYSTMAKEAHQQLVGHGQQAPSHLFLQAGVGAMAGAVLGYYHKIYAQNTPITTILEPKQAACIYQSVQNNGGDPVRVAGELQTIMAGLACGEPNPLTWPILRDYASSYFSCADYLAASGMRILANPVRGDAQIIAGESGAIGLGVVYALLSRPECGELRESLGLNSHSTILCFNTEGATDPKSYSRIVWEGLYPMMRN